VTVASKAGISVDERCLVLAVILDCFVVFVVVARTALLIDVMKEGSFAGITELATAELKEVSTGLQTESVVVRRTEMKTVGTKAEIGVEITKWETDELQWRTVAGGRVQMIAGRYLVAVELREDLVAERTDAAEELRTDARGSLLGIVDPLLAAETCCYVGCLSKCPSVPDGIVHDENAAPCDDAEKSTEKKTSFSILKILYRY
jgi:hypothetical protein